MVTPLIIQVLFWIGVGLCVLVGLVNISLGAAAPYGGGKLVLSGVLYLLLGPLFTRIYCELLIIGFRILDTLRNIERNTAEKTA